MKQLTQKLKDGRMQITEVPVPDLRTGMVLLRNLYSLISAGTEGSTVQSILRKSQEASPAANKNVNGKYATL